MSPRMGDVVEPRKRDPLKPEQHKAAREFATADGELVRIEVDITRMVHSGPVIVSSHRAQPRGQHHRYRQHVDPMDVWRVCLDWLDALPDDYLMCEECEDVRAGHWHRLVSLLRAVPCVVEEEQA